MFKLYVNDMGPRNGISKDEKQNVGWSGVVTNSRSYNCQTVVC